MLQQVQVVDRREMKGGVVRLRLQRAASRSAPFAAVVFGIGAMDGALKPGSLVSVVGLLKLDVWRGNGAVQFVIEDVLGS